MNIRIKTTDYQMTPDVERYLGERLASLEKLISRAENTRCEVEVGRDGGNQRHGANMWFAEIRIIAPGEAHAFARNHAESVNSAIDDVKEEVERQLRRSKRLHVRMLRHGGAYAKRLLRLGD